MSIYLPIPPKSKHSGAHINVALKLALFIGMAFDSPSAIAQLTESDTLHFGYKASVNGSWITGNVERLLINTTFDVSHVRKHIGVKSSNTYTYGTIFKYETENDIFSRNFVYLNPRKKLYPYLMLWVQNSKRQQIVLRNQAGIGLTYTIIHSSLHLLKISETLSAEETRYNGTEFYTPPKNLEHDRVSNLRSTIRLLGQHHLSNRKLRLLYETWYQPAFGDGNNWRYLMNAALSIPISTHVSFRSALMYSYESIALVGIKKEDRILTFGITVGNL